ncbi:hypothetical protein [Spiroplasma endosymbiont of Seladonia tumulorum]|uniref:hypothetical protein n=1 Tax=Spiroplasma endosymbiont of Seladonia tumulorum TaxID=3066321 RepID=UPI0030D4A3A4
MKKNLELLLPRFFLLNTNLFYKIRKKRKKINLIKRKNNISKKNIICEKIKLKTPVTKVDGFARINFSENVFFWTKELFPKNKYSLFQIKGLIK